MKLPISNEGTCHQSVKTSSRSPKCESVGQTQPCALLGVPGLAALSRKCTEPRHLGTPWHVDWVRSAAGRELCRDVLAQNWVWSTDRIRGATSESCRLNYVWWKDCLHGSRRMGNTRPQMPRNDLRCQRGFLSHQTDQ